jgi:hypothetical protein
MNMISSTTLVNKEVGRKNFSFCFHLCATEIKLSERTVWFARFAARELRCLDLIRFVVCFNRRLG